VTKLEKALSFTVLLYVMALVTACSPPAPADVVIPITNKVTENDPNNLYGEELEDCGIINWKDCHSIMED